ncbi:hypothetical protein EVAR_26966_1 [Eumeta japonica]|uniref:Uncharacterized protein n=1 Tax=Eumeta variegata TaxID=151549 RepID=A0A4C1VL03_EUMVA|nr:hypothetical protein EVAR_26966_1 [Eumeta japonica]
MYITTRLKYATIIDNTQERRRDHNNILKPDRDSSALTKDSLGRRTGAPRRRSENYSMIGLMRCYRGVARRARYRKRDAREANLSVGPSSSFDEWSPIHSCAGARGPLGDKKRRNCPHASSHTNRVLACK